MAAPLRVTLDQAAKAELDRRYRTTRDATARTRYQMVLLRADGASLADVARWVGVAPRMVAKWLRRYRQQGLRGLGDKARPGRPPGFSPRSRCASGQAGL